MITADPNLNHQLASRGTGPGFDAYLRARRRAWLAATLAGLVGRSRRLRPLAQANARYASGARSVGLHPVPIQSIRGSENRTRDFDRDFDPLTEHTQERWIRLYNARQAGETLPPVVLIRRGETFYVRDGHHRISIARSLGQEYIEAEVIEMEPADGTPGR
jgi:hypothetical protein